VVKKKAREVLKSIDEKVAGITTHNVPAIRQIRREFSRLLANEDAPLIVAIAEALVRRGIFSDRLIAFELVAAHPKAFLSLNESTIVRWARGLESWGDVDLFGCTIGGRAWREGLVSDKVIARWSCSSDRWQRRLALVCTVPLNSRARGGRIDQARTLQVCKTLVDDRDDMVVKAMSWALRELAKRDPQSVQAFLEKHNDRIAGRVKREVKNKLTTGKKNPRQSSRRAMSSSS
jgi:3-methyladenine DNA glycosylase AlkD